MRLRNKILLAATAAVALAATAAAVTIGPRNIIGMLRYDQRTEGAFKVGDRAPDVELLSLDGARVHLAERFGPKPAVLIFGSFT